jgi:hypothetical protein
MNVAAMAAETLRVPGISRSGGQLAFVTVLTTLRLLRVRERVRRMAVRALRVRAVRVMVARGLRMAVGTCDRQRRMLLFWMRRVACGARLPFDRRMRG